MTSVNISFDDFKSVLTDLFGQSLNQKAEVAAQNFWENVSAISDGVSQGGQRNLLVSGYSIPWIVPVQRREVEPDLGDGRLHGSSQHAALSLGRDQAGPAGVDWRYASRDDDDLFRFWSRFGCAGESRLCTRHVSVAGLDERDQFLFDVVGDHSSRVVSSLWQRRIFAGAEGVHDPAAEAVHDEDQRSERGAARRPVSGLALVGEQAA